MRDLEFNVNAKRGSMTGFEAAEARAKAFNGELDRIGSGYAMAATAAKAFAGAFALTAVAQFASTVRDVIGDAADLVDLADKIGISTDNIQRLQYGFKLAGIEAGEVDGILSQWSRRIGEAYTHGGKLADVLKANGISLTDSNGKLRSQVDLMRDYADLMSRAGSSSEKQVLSALAFGKANDEMINALSGGSAAFIKMMAAANEAGGVLDEKMLRKAAEIDDAFDRMWRTFEIAGKSAILNVAPGLYEMLQKITDVADRYEKMSAVARASQKEMENNGIFGLFPQTELDQAKMDRKGVWGLTLPDASGQTDRLPWASVQDRFGTRPDEAAQNDALVRQMQTMFGPTKTIIPDDTGARKSSTAAAKEQVSAYEQVITKLQQEKDLIGLSSLDQKILNEQRHAGVTATSEQGKAIAALVTDMERQREATKSLAETTDFLKSSTASYFTTFRHGLEEGESALQALGDAFSGFADTLMTKLEERAAGGLIDAFMPSGSGGFNLLSSLFGVASSTSTAGTGGSGLGGGASGKSLIAPAGRADAGAKVRIEQKIPAKIDVQEEDDGAGGKQLAVIIDEQNAANNARAGSKSSRSLRNTFNLNRRLTRR